MMEKIQVSQNQRFLVTESGTPFFWLGDTAWELFHRLNHAEAEHYLETRRQQGFNVIQAVVLAELDGLHTPNPNGRLPLCGDDPSRPNELYFQDVDAIIRLAAEKGLYIGLLPTWGDKVHGGLWGVGPVVFDAENAQTFGKFLGQRYRDYTNILWILGGDRPANGYENLWKAIEQGIITGLGYQPFFTYHPNGGASSSAWLHETDWLDMNMLQSGHVLLDAPNWEMIRSDYDLKPTKPVLDGEPCYEDHPVDPFLRQWKPELGRFSDYDVRKQAYRAVFSGACGHTYGHHSIWQFWNLGREPINFPMLNWEDAVLRSGATQMVHLKNLMLSRSYLSRIPDWNMLTDIQEPAPADNNIHFDADRAAYACATRCVDGSYAMVYFPNAEQNLRVDLQVFGDQVKAWWYDPRNGNAHFVGEYPNETMMFTSPIAGPDWVLVLDDQRKNFNEPGKPLSF